MSIEKPDCVLDILTKSILMHPSLFAEACEREAADDRRYVAGRPDMPKLAKNAALSRAEALEFAASAARTHSSAACAAMAIIDRQTTPYISISWISAFAVASRLLCYPGAVLRDFAAKQESVS